MRNLAVSMGDLTGSMGEWQFVNLARHSWGTKLYFLGTLGAHLGYSWGTVGAKSYLRHTWGTLGADAVGAQLRHTWGTVEAKK